MNGVEALFSAKSIAIVGVSEDPTKIGSVVYGNLVNAGYKGSIYIVNPKHKQLYDNVCYGSVLDIEEEVDTVCIAVPQKFVKPVVLDAVKKKVKAIVIISSGFGESGEEGKKLEQEIVKICKEGNVRILGPNCLGVMATQNRINISFAATNPFEGNIAFISQSGAFCTSLLDMASPRNIGFSHMISIGNKADINELELITSLNKEPEVKVLAAYLEEVDDGYDFFKTYTTQANPKPFIIFKPGKTDEAIKAINSHTGSIAGSLSTFHTAAKQHGIVLTYSMRDLMNLMMGFSWSKLPKGDRVAIITNAGGPGIIATDEIVEQGLKLAKLSEETVKKLNEDLPSTASKHNPIDIGGDALSDRYQSTVKTVLEDPNVDILMIVLTPQFVTQIEETARFLVNTVKLSGKTVVPVFIGEKYVINGIRHFYDNKVQVYKDISDAVKVLKAMLDFGKWQSQSSAVAQSWNIVSQIAPQPLHSSAASNSLNEEEVATLLKTCDIEVAPQRLCSHIEEAKEFLERNNEVVLKISNSILAHKIDKKGVYTKITTEDELSNAWFELSKLTSTPERLKILVQKQIHAEQELFIGAHRDGGKDVYAEGKGYGHVLIFGQGGTYTEVYKDYAFALVPADRKYLLNSLASTKISNILTGVRNQEFLAVGKFIQLLEKVQQLVIKYPSIASLDLNPVLITKEDVYVVDVKVFVD